MKRDSMVAVVALHVALEVMAWAEGRANDWNR